MGQKDKTLVHSAIAQRPPLNAHADLLSGARGLHFGLSLHLHPYIMYTSSKSAGVCTIFLAGLIYLLANTISTKISCPSSYL